MLQLDYFPLTISKENQLCLQNQVINESIAFNLEYFNQQICMSTGSSKQKQDQCEPQTKNFYNQFFNLNLQLYQPQGLNTLQIQQGNLINVQSSQWLPNSTLAYLELTQQQKKFDYLSQNNQRQLSQYFSTRNYLSLDLRRRQSLLSGQANNNGHLQILPSRSSYTCFKALDLSFQKDLYGQRIYNYSIKYAMKSRHSLQLNVKNDKAANSQSPSQNNYGDIKPKAKSEPSRENKYQLSEGQQSDRSSYQTLVEPQQQQEDRAIIPEFNQYSYSGTILQQSPREGEFNQELKKKHASQFGCLKQQHTDKLSQSSSNQEKKVKSFPSSKRSLKKRTEKNLELRQKQAAQISERQKLTFRIEENSQTEKSLQEKNKLLNKAVSKASQQSNKNKGPIKKFKTERLQQKLKNKEAIKIQPKAKSESINQMKLQASKDQSDSDRSYSILIEGQRQIRRENQIKGQTLNQNLPVSQTIQYGDLQTVNNKDQKCQSSQIVDIIQPFLEEAVKLIDGGLEKISQNSFNPNEFGKRLQELAPQQIRSSEGLCKSCQKLRAKVEIGLQFFRPNLGPIFEQDELDQERENRMNLIKALLKTTIMAQIATSKCSSGNWDSLKTMIGFYL